MESGVRTNPFQRDPAIQNIMTPDVLLLSCEQDGNYTLRRKGSESVHRFPSKLEALTFICLTREYQGAWLVICDATGEIETQAPTG